MEASTEVAGKPVSQDLGHERWITDHSSRNAHHGEVSLRVFDRTVFSNLGMYVYAVAAIAAGIINLLWHDFATGWQPIQAFGDHVPGRELYACITAVWLVVGGAALFWRRTARVGAMSLAIVYLIFAVFWLPRLYWAPHILGLRSSVIIGVLGGVAEQVMPVCGGVIVSVWLAAPDSPSPSKATVIARVVFGLCSVDFGRAHRS